MDLASSIDALWTNDLIMMCQWQFYSYGWSIKDLSDNAYIVLLWNRTFIYYSLFGHNMHKLETYSRYIVDRNKTVYLIISFEQQEHHRVLLK